MAPSDLEAQNPPLPNGNHGLDLVIQPKGKLGPSAQMDQIFRYMPPSVSSLLYLVSFGVAPMVVHQCYVDSGDRGVLKDIVTNVDIAAKQIVRI